jgi:hypothetical protein
MCEGAMLNSENLFLTYLLKPFCELASDPIVNVRLELSLTLEKCFEKYQDNLKL